MRLDGDLSGERRGCLQPGDGANDVKTLGRLMVCERTTTTSEIRLADGLLFWPATIVDMRVEGARPAPQVRLHCRGASGEAALSSASGTRNPSQVEFIGMDSVLVAGALDQCDRAGGSREMGLL